MGMYTMKPPIQTVVACGEKIVETMAVGSMEWTSIVIIPMDGEPPERAIIQVMIPTVAPQPFLNQKHKPCAGWYKTIIL